MTNQEQPDPTASGAEPTAPLPQPGQGYPAQQPYPGQPGSFGQQSYPGQPQYPAQPQYPTQPQYPAQSHGTQPGYTPQPGYPGQPEPTAPQPGYTTQQPGYTAQQPGYAPQAGYPGQPAAYGQPPVPPAKKSKIPLIIGGVAGIAILAVIAATLLTPGSSTPISAPVPGQSASSTPEPATAADAVKGYLEALARSDAAAALAYAATTPADTSMLTNEVLVASNANAPISGITVSAGTGSSGFEQISADYTLGDRQVSANFTVTKEGNLWRLDRVSQAAYLDSVIPEAVALKLNGVALTSSDPELFPGSYTVTSDSERYSVSKGSFEIDSPNDYTTSTSSMKLTLSKSGQAEVRKAAQAKLASCLKAKKLAPSGCGFGTRLPSGKPRNSSIKWKVTKGANSLKTTKLNLASGDPTSVTANPSISLRVDFSSTNGNRWRGYSSIYSMDALFSGDKVSVVFN